MPSQRQEFREPSWANSYQKSSRDLKKGWARISEQSPTNLALEGAIWYLDLCATAIRVQENRLLREHGDNMVDLWLTLVALRNGIRAVRLASRVADKPDEINRLIDEYEATKASEQLRNVFEHFDAYFLGVGNLQKSSGLHFSPQISFQYENDESISAWRMRATVKVLDYELAIPDATQEMGNVLWRVRCALDDEHNSAS